MAVTDCRVCATPLPPDARFCMTCGVDVTDPGATVQTRRDPTQELQERLARTLSGRYEVRRLLGAGGMASVFLADEIGLDRPVAIKVLPPELSRDEGLVARFEREARTAAKLDHPHIIPIHRVESEAGLHYFVMKYVPGRSLESLLEDAEPIALERAARILREAATALGHAHARGVVHRDVKPANIMLDGDDRVILTDFGIARAGESTHLTQTGMIIGTPHYMAPEQALGRDVDGRADQYALAVVAYEMLARQCPFTGDSAHTIIYKHIHEPPRPLASWRPDVPSHVAEAIAIALSKEPGDRFATMEEFARAIGGDGAALASRASHATMPIGAAAAAAAAKPTPSRAPTMKMHSGAPRQSARARRAPVWAGIAGVVVLAAAAAGWLATRPDASTDAAAPELAAQVPDAPVPKADSGATAAAEPQQPATEPASNAGGTAARPDRNRGTVPPTKDAPRRPAADPPQSAMLTVSTDPYGTLYIDGLLIGDTPVANHPLEVGRTYRLRVEREGYRTWTETITVRDPNPIRRSRPLEPGGPP